MKKSLLIIALLSLNTAIKSAEDDQTAHNKESFFSRAVSGVWAAASVPVDAGVYCVKKSYDAAGKCASALYKSADGMMYVVGVATTGVVIYVFLNGKFEKKVLIRDVAPDADAQTIFEFLYTMNFPLFGKIMWEMPQSAGQTLEKLMQKNTQMTAYAQEVAVSVSALQEEMGSMLDTFAIRLQSPGLKKSTRGLLEFIYNKIEASFKALEEIQKKL